MIASIYIEEHQYIFDEPQTLNFGGKYLYSFIHLNRNELLVNRIINDKYISNLFNISDSDSNLNLLSAIVGQNGTGKSTILDIIRSNFISHRQSMPYSSLIIITEENDESKLLFSNLRYDKIYIVDKDFNNDDTNAYRTFLLEPDKFKTIEDAAQSYQSIYYSPHFDLKFNNDFDEIDNYDISLDQFIKQDLENTDQKDTDENGWKFPLHEELLFKNTMRQIEFLNSSVYKDNSIFREVFNIPQYETGILNFREVPIPTFHNTPNKLKPIIKLILQKVEEDNNNWIKIQKFDENDKLLNEEDIYRHLLKRYVIKSFVSIVIHQMEKKNTYLDEAQINDPYNMDRFKEYSAKELLKYFIEESYIEKGKLKKPIFNSEKIIKFLDKLNGLIDKESNPDKISKQSLHLNLDEIKEVLELNRSFLLNLRDYFPPLEGLKQKSDYIDSFIDFRPTDRNLSSGENALLNFYSKLYSFIQNNLIKESKSLPDKDNYVLLLDEADLGFHPVWKKRYIDAILKTIPYFFEELEVVPTLQIIITTHDSLTLSDFPNNNVIFLQKNGDLSSVISNNDQLKIQKTFGANISELLSHSFFVEDGLIGDFSKSKINEVIDWINQNKKLVKKRISTEDFQKEYEHYKKVINLIDEKVVKLKLTEMITDLVPDDEYYNQVIDKEIEFLKRRKK